MRATPRRVLALPLLLMLAGCDPNPNGPAAPSVPPATDPASPPGSVPRKSIPLRQVGAPIGLIVRPAGPSGSR